jgi:hypothetical protein
VDSAKVDTIDYADLSDADLIRMALEEGELAFEAAVGRRRPTSRKLHLRLCLRTDAGGWDLDGGDTTQRFINQRLWTSEDTLDRNTYGKALICSMYLMNSDAARALRYEIPAGVIYTTGGVYARLEETLDDGSTVVVEAIAAASGVQGVWDKVYAGIVANGYCAYWVLRAKAQLARRLAAAGGDGA